MPSAKTNFLLLFALLSSQSLTLSIPQATDPTALLADNKTLNGELHCYPNNPFIIGRPSARDCISAIRRLPSSHIHGTFHEDPSSGDDRFKLPVSKSSGRCQVLVELKSLSPEDGTWLGLNLAATQLTSACADREGYLAKRGGWTDAGDNDKIRITLQTLRQVLDKVGNETITNKEV